MTVLQRYLLLQVPGWTLAAIVLYCLHRWLRLPWWVVASLLCADVAKDFILYPLLKRSYEVRPAGGADHLVGESGVARQGFSEAGYIMIRGELWHAELAPGSNPVQEGSHVRVLSVKGLTLQVQPGDSDRTSS